MKRAAKYMLMHSNRDRYGDERRDSRYDDRRYPNRDYRDADYRREREYGYGGRRAEYRGNVDFAMTSGRPRREAWDDDDDGTPELTPERAKKWTKAMKNADGTTGAHWTQEHTSQVMAQRGYHYDPAIWHAVMCSIYSDYAEVAKKYGLSGNAEFFADMAHAWLDDKDAVENKAAAYYCYVVMH